MCGGSVTWCNLARIECCQLRGRPHRLYRCPHVASAATFEGRSSRRAARWRHGTSPRCCANECTLSGVRWGRGRCRDLLCICQTLSAAPCPQVSSGTHQRLRWNIVFDKRKFIVSLFHLKYQDYMPRSATTLHHRMWSNICPQEFLFIHWKVKNIWSKVTKNIVN